VARSLALQLAKMNNAPTGFVCANEVASLGVMAGLREAGRTPGLDVELVSRDGAFISDYLFPPLPTLFLDIRKVAKTLCDFLLRRIQGEAAETLQRVLPCELRYMTLPRVSSNEPQQKKMIKFGDAAGPVSKPSVYRKKRSANNDSSY
jgi:DNA-binding LacI/PurR family transcriptional regulator